LLVFIMLFGIFNIPGTIFIQDHDDMVLLTKSYKFS
jgi:hypothetical protein